MWWKLSLVVAALAGTAALLQYTPISDRFYVSDYPDPLEGLWGTGDAAITPTVLTVSKEREM